MCFTESADKYELESLSEDLQMLLEEDIQVTKYSILTTLTKK
jgi:hypothetical protein